MLSNTSCTRKSSLYSCISNITHLWLYADKERTPTPWIGFLQNRYESNNHNITNQPLGIPVQKLLLIRLKHEVVSI